MTREEFAIGREFWTAGGAWRCTDVGTRTVVAIKLDGVVITGRDPETGAETKRTLSRAAAEAEGWFAGPPYRVGEYLFAEDDVDSCYPTREACVAAVGAEPDELLQHVRDLAGDAGLPRTGARRTS
jgi:hypothetical protein